MTSFTRTVASGATATFSVAQPYLDKTHVYVYKDDVLLTVTTDYTWPTDGTIQLVAGPPAAGTVINAKRLTPAGALVDFQPGNLASDDLDLQALQGLYLAEEARDLAQDLETRGWYTALLAAGGTITKGASTELVAYDASGNMLGSGYTVASLGASVAAAAAYASAALVSENAASASASGAAASKTAADADAVATAADRVQTGLDAVATAADVVSTNSDAASTAADALSTAAYAASAAADAISTAADAASTAADVVTTNADVVSTGAALAAFQAVYLGAQAADPTVDLNGDPVSAGDLYWNTTASEMRVYNGAAWEVAYAPVSGYMLTATYAAQITNWDAAYSWGNHASAGYAPIANPTFTGTAQSGHFVVPSAGSIQWEGGVNRITNNDGDGHVQIRFGNYFSGTTVFSHDGGACYIGSNIDATSGTYMDLYVSANSGAGTDQPVTWGYVFRITATDVRFNGKALLDTGDLSSQAQAEAGTDNTTVMTPLATAYAIAASQRACKAWARFNGTGTVAIDDSFNVSSITDNGTGDYTVNFTAAMGNANYACLRSVDFDSITGSGVVSVTETRSATTGAVRVTSQSGSTAQDVVRFDVAIFGD